MLDKPYQQDAKEFLEQNLDIVEPIMQRAAKIYASQKTHDLAGAIKKAIKESLDFYQELYEGKTCRSQQIRSAIAEEVYAHHRKTA